jgi:hypothetical protein
MKIGKTKMTPRDPKTRADERLTKRFYRSRNENQTQKEFIHHFIRDGLAHRVNLTPGFSAATCILSPTALSAAERFCGREAEAWA